MNKIELLEIVKKGEDSYTEFKEERVYSNQSAEERMSRGRLFLQ